MKEKVVRNMEEKAQEASKFDLARAARELEKSSLHPLEPNALFRCLKLNPEPRLGRQVFGVCQPDEKGLHLLVPLDRQALELLRTKSVMFNHYKAIMVEVKNPAELSAQVTPMHTQLMLGNVYVKLRKYELLHDPVDGNMAITRKEEQRVVYAQNTLPPNAEKLFIALPVDMACEVLKSIL